MASEPSRGAALVAALGTVVALGAAVLATELFVAPAYRPTAIRIICALVLLLALARVRATVAAAVERRAAWGGDELGEGWLDRRAADPRLQRFRDEIRFSARSYSYFEHLLWPRLAALGRAHGGSSAGLEKPPARRFGLGPSVAALGRLIVALETRR